MDKQSGSLESRTAIVTGSSKGIGFETAKELGLAGAKVVLCGRHPETLADAHSELLRLKITCVAKVVDLSEPDGAEQLVRHAIDEYQGIDVLVNNVGGLNRTGTFSELDDEDWVHAFNLNFLSVVRMCRQALPYLKESSAPRIINVLSMVAKQPGAYNPHYSTMKAAVLNLTKHLGRSLATQGILGNAVSPGIVDTPAWSTYIAQKAASEKRSVSEVKTEEDRRASVSSPLGRLGQSSEIARLIHYLASDLAAFIVGENIAIDGGRMHSI